MRIDCPFCGPRGGHEFVARGDAMPERPSGVAGEGAFAAFVYLRDNPAGPFAELWYHAQGCRNWLIVERDTRTHAIASVRLAAEAGR